MDIDLLAKMVKEAVLDQDAVTLPGVGSFVAELVPSTFSDKGYTINPPYRRLYFSPRQGSDTLLAAMYARDNGVDLEMATRILTEFLSELKEVLKVRKTVAFPGLGRLRATRENHFFFVADEDLDIYPEGLGLVPISLKTHVETPEEVATAVAGLAELIAEPEPAPEQTPAPEPTPEPVEDKPVPEDSFASLGMTLDGHPEEVKDRGRDLPGPEPVPEPEPEPAPEPKPESVLVPKPHKSRKPRKSRRWVRILLIVLGILLVLLLAFVVIGRLVPDWLDPLLYSREELEILRY
jgi:nucleoid DNA-binding protein